MDQSDRLSLAQGAYIDSLPEGWVRRYTCSQIFSFFILKVGVRGLGSRPSLPVLVDVTSLPMISFRGEGFEVLSTIFHGYVMLLLTLTNCTARAPLHKRTFKRVGGRVLW